MRSASGNRASRVCMGFLARGSQSLPGRDDRLANAPGSCATRDVVKREHALESHEIVEVTFEMRINVLQLFERESLQLARFIESESDRLAYLRMCDSERHALAGEIGCCRERVHIAGFSGPLHTLEIKLDRFHPAGRQRKQ